MKTKSAHALVNGKHNFNFSSMSGRLGAIISPYIVQLGPLTGIAWLPMAVFAAAALLRQGEADRFADGSAFISYGSRSHEDSLTFLYLIIHVKKFDKKFVNTFIVYRR